MKKLISLFLALLMVFSLAAVAFAVEGEGEDEPIDYTEIWFERNAKVTHVENYLTDGDEYRGTTGGSITITNIHMDPDAEVCEVITEYQIYKMLHLESFDPDSKQFAYIIVEEWLDFFVADPEDDTTGIGAEYITVNNNGYADWGSKDRDTYAAEFAKLALKYAQDNGIQPVASSVVRDADGKVIKVDDNFIKDNGNGTYNGVFEGLTLGYYLVDSNVGALCGLSTTSPDGLINAKNGAPTMGKQVQENSNIVDGTASFGPSNSAQIGDYVKFDITITAADGAESYVLHDTMTEGFDFEQYIVYQTDDEGKELLDEAGKPMVDESQSHGILYIKHLSDAHPLGIVLTEASKADSEGNYDYTVVTHPGDGCTFHVVFTQDMCDTLVAGDRLVMIYTAKLNEDAAIHGISTGNNTNSAWLQYGDDHTTTTTTTTTQTYFFDLVKTDGDNKLLPGAEFKLYFTSDCTDELTIFLCEDGTYRLGTTLMGGESPCDNTIVIPASGWVRIKGLDEAHYFLKETKAPEGGYQLLSSPVDVNITADKLLQATFVGDKYTPETGVQVKNSAGTSLPTTGGLGTLLFTLLGGGTALGTGVVLVTKKRMSMIEE